MLRTSMSSSPSGDHGSHGLGSSDTVPWTCHLREGGARRDKVDSAAHGLSGAGHSVQRC